MIVHIRSQRRGLTRDWCSLYPSGWGNYSIAALIRAQESLFTAESSDAKPSGVIRTPSAKSCADIANRGAKNSWDGGAASRWMVSTTPG